MHDKPDSRFTPSKSLRSMHNGDGRDDEVGLQVCVFLAPLFSAFCALSAYLFVKEIRGQGAGLMAAAFTAIVPSYISRSVAGSFDNEGVAIFALVFVFYLYVKVCCPLGCW